MVEKPTRYRHEVDESPAENTTWEIFIAEESDEQAKHMGSVVATNPDEAYREATRMFGWYVAEIWVTPLTEMTKYKQTQESADAEPIDIAESDEERTYE
ncbi:MAG: hypothetical protein ABEI06_01470 [Halobacteriaceae archaeon]